LTFIKTDTPRLKNTGSGGSTLTDTMAKMSAIFIRPLTRPAIFICPRPRAVSMGEMQLLR
jgi:hypothetical protein